MVCPWRQARWHVHLLENISAILCRKDQSALLDILKMLTGVLENNADGRS
jgi:hypothetical protein